jgi:hypothetical protein
MVKMQIGTASTVGSRAKPSISMPNDFADIERYGVLGFFEKT